MPPMYYDGIEAKFVYYNGKETTGYYNGVKIWPDESKAFNVITTTDGNGTLTAVPVSGYAGDTVTLSNTPNSHYTFNGYTITGATLTGNKFNFVDSDVSVNATFKQDPVYTLTLQNDGHGTLTANKLTGYAGDTVTLSPTYKTYYRFNNYGVTGGTIAGNTFTFGAANATAKANFKVNTFTASGNFIAPKNVTSSRNFRYYSYSNTTYYTTGTPTSFYSNTNTSYFSGTDVAKTKTSALASKIWKPTNCSAYHLSGTGWFSHHNDKQTTATMSCAIRTENNNLATRTVTARYNSQTIFKTKSANSATYQGLLYAFVSAGNVSSYCVFSGATWSASGIAP